MPTFIHGKKTKLLLNEFDITQFFREVSGPMNADEVETTAFGAGDYKSYIAGFVASTLTLGGMFENATDVDPSGATKTLDRLLDQILGDDAASRLLAVGVNGYGVGQRVRLFEGTELSYELSSGIGDVVAVSANFSSKSPSKMGVSLHDLASEAATGNGATVDDNTGRTAAPVGGSVFGAVAQLHVTANTRSDATTFKVQHSVDNVTWVDFITFDSVAAGAFGAQRKQVSGNVNRYLRVVWTYGVGTGAATFHAAVARLNN